MMLQNTAPAMPTSPTPRPPRFATWQTSSAYCSHTPWSTEKKPAIETTARVTPPPSTNQLSSSPTQPVPTLPRTAVRGLRKSFCERRSMVTL